MPSLGLSLGLDSSSSRLLTSALALIPVATTNSFTWNGYTWNKQLAEANEHGSIRFARSDYIDIPFDDIGTITNTFIFYFTRPFDPPPAYQDKWVVATQINVFYNDSDNYGYYGQVNEGLNSFYFPTALTYNPAGVSVSMLPTSFNGLSITNVA
jgi:hypothetical protein